MALSKGFEEIGDAFFGGAEKDAARHAEEALQDSRRNLQNATETARGESKSLYGGASRQLNQGFQQALDMWDQLSNRQANMLDQGNQISQGQRVNTLNQSIAALLGSPMDTSGMGAQPINHNFNMRYQLPEPMDPMTDLVDERGVPFDLQNIPFEASNIVGMLRDGNITYQEAAEWLSTGEGYGSFDGLPRSTINRLLANFVPGGSRYSESTDLSKAGRDAFKNPDQAWKQLYG